MTAEKKPTIMERLIVLSETDIKKLKVISYGIASISLVVALYRIKPFAKFRTPSSIPSRFIQRKVQLQGTVKQIDPSCGTLLMVDHKPLIPLPRLSSPKYLPVKIAGLDITTNGISWLQTVIGQREITFIPVTKEKEYLNCIVLLKQNQEHVKIGEELTKVGFALINKDFPKLTSKDKDVSNYQKCLLKAQKWAQNKRNGYWHFIIRPTVLWKMKQNLAKKVKDILPSFIIKQLNI